MPHNKLHDTNGNGQDMLQGFTAPDGHRQRLCDTPTEAKEAETGEVPDGQTTSVN